MSKKNLSSTNLMLMATMFALNCAVNTPSFYFSPYHSEERRTEDCIAMMQNALLLATYEVKMEIIDVELLNAVDYASTHSEMHNRYGNGLLARKKSLPTLSIQILDTLTMVNVLMFAIDRAFFCETVPDLAILKIGFIASIDYCLGCLSVLDTLTLTGSDLAESNFWNLPLISSLGESNTLYQWKENYRIDYEAIQNLIKN